MLIAGFCYDSKFMFYDNIKYKMNHDVKIRENNLIINVKNTGKIHIDLIHLIINLVVIILLLQGMKN